MIYGSVCSGVVAQVDGWVHGGDLPRCLFDPLGGQMEDAQ